MSQTDSKDGYAIDAIHEIEDGLSILANRARELGMNMATFIGTLEMFKQHAIQRAFTDPDEEQH